MKKLAFVLCVLFLSGTVMSTSAQNLKKFIPKKKESTEETEESKTEGEEEKGKGLAKFKTDLKKGLNEILGEEDGETNSNTEETAEKTTEKKEKTNYKESDDVAAKGLDNMLGKMGLKPKPAKVKASYDFEAYIEMTITNFEKEKETESVVYKTYLDTDTQDYGMEIVNPEDDVPVFMIFDTENSQMITLSEEDGEKSGFAITFNPDQMQAIGSEYEEEETQDASLNIYKTGKKKKILGYTCLEYETKDDESTINMWITKELDKDMQKNYLKNSSFGGMFGYAGHAEGSVLEYIVTENKSKSVMTVTDIQLKKKHSISTAGYEIMGMGAGFGGM